MKKAVLVFLLLACPAWAAQYNHINNAIISYSTSDIAACDWLGRHFTMAVNPSGPRYTAVKNADPQIKCMKYLTISTFGQGEDAAIQAFCSARGLDFNSMHLWTTSNVCVEDIAAVGGACTGSVCTSSGNRLEYCGWTSRRLAPDFRYTGVWDWVTYEYLTEIGNGYDGAMEDEAVFYYHPIWDYYMSMMCFPFKPSRWLQGSSSDINGWGGYSHDQIRDSLIVLKQQGWLPLLTDSLNAHGYLRFANPAAYGCTGSDVIDDCVLTGTGVLFGEGMYLASIGHGVYNGECVKVMEELAASPAGKAIIWLNLSSSDAASLGSWQRQYMERLVFYYSLADTTHFWLLLQKPGNAIFNADTATSWIDAVAYDIGQPVGSRYVAQQGTDGAGQSYQLYRRDFKSGNVVILYREQVGSSYGSSSAVTYDLGDNYKLLNHDTTFGNPTQTASIRNCEGQIYVGTGAATDTIPPADIQDLGDLNSQPGNNHREMILTWYATGDDSTSGTAHHYEIRYSQNPIDEFNWTQVALAANPPTPLPAGSQQSYTLQAPNEGEVYYVAIRAFDEVGNSSPIAYFAQSFAAGIRSPPTLLAEVDQGSLSATLTCSTVVSYYDPIIYEFALTDSSSVDTAISSTSDTADSKASVTFTGLDGSAAYYWLCRAVAVGADSSDWSAARKFRLSNVSPDAPTLSYPEDFDTLVIYQGESLAVFVNNGLDNDGPNSLTYQFELYDESATSLLASDSGIVEGSSTTGWTVPIALGENVSYSWRARCYDGLDHSSWMDWAHFTVASFGTGGPVPDEPQIITYPNPVRFSQGQYITFRLPDYPVDLLIQTVSGETVLLRTGVSGEWQWSGLNGSANMVAVGVYSWFVRGTGQNGKILVKP